MHLVPVVIAGRDLAEKLDFAERPAGSFGHRAERIFRHVHRQPCFFHEQTIEAAQERARQLF